METKVYLVLIDNNFYMNRRNEKFNGFSQYQISIKLAKSLINKISTVKKSLFLSVCNPNVTDTKLMFSQFSKDFAGLCAKIDELADFKQPLKLLHVFICDVLNEISTYWGPWTNIEVLLFTDGDPTCFTLPINLSTEDVPFKQIRNFFFHFISLSDKQLSSNLTDIYRSFRDQSNILCASDSDFYSNDASLDAFVEKFAAHVFANLFWTDTKSTSPLLLSKSDDPNILITCGHLQKMGHYTPAPGIFTINGSTHDRATSLIVEIFGFLNVNDLGHVPVMGRLIVISHQSGADADFIQLLSTSLDRTKTVGVCHIYSVECLSSSDSDRLFWSYGFVHHLNAKHSVLCLSVFDQGCKSFPWLGQFIHFAPVTDFSGSQLYDDRNETSPFPVRTADHLSYRSDCLWAIGTPFLIVYSHIMQSGIKTKWSKGTRFSSWTMLTTMQADLNKILRLGKRLPEKSQLLFKELKRVRTAALVYGCSDLLVQLNSTIHAIHNVAVDAELNKTKPDPLVTCLIEIRGLLKPGLDDTLLSQERD